MHQAFTNPSTTCREVSTVAHNVTSITKYFVLRANLYLSQLAARIAEAFVERVHPPTTWAEEAGDGGNESRSTHDFAHETTLDLFR